MTTYVVTFDISDKENRRKVERELTNRHAERAQRSVGILELPGSTAKSVYEVLCNFIMPGDELLVTEVVLSNTRFNGDSPSQHAFQSIVDAQASRAEIQAMKRKKTEE